MGKKDTFRGLFTGITSVPNWWNSKSLWNPSSPLSSSPWFPHPGSDRVGRRSFEGRFYDTHLPSTTIPTPLPSPTPGPDPVCLYWVSGPFSDDGTPEFRLDRGLRRESWVRTDRSTGRTGSTQSRGTVGEIKFGHRGSTLPTGVTDHLTDYVMSYFLLDGTPPTFLYTISVGKSVPTTRREDHTRRYRRGSDLLNTHLLLLGSH